MQHVSVSLEVSSEQDIYPGKSIYIYIKLFNLLSSSVVKPAHLREINSNSHVLGTEIYEGYMYLKHTWHMANEI
jgi:hypothetical protein